MELSLSVNWLFIELKQRANQVVWFAIYRYRTQNQSHRNWNTTKKVVWVCESVCVWACVCRVCECVWTFIEIILFRFERVRCYESFTNINSIFYVCKVYAVKINHKKRKWMILFIECRAAGIELFDVRSDVNAPVNIRFIENFHS